MKKFYKLLTLLTLTLISTQLTYAQLEQIGTAAHQEGEGESAIYYVLWDTPERGFWIYNSRLEDDKSETIYTWEKGPGDVLTFDARRNPEKKYSLDVSKGANGTFGSSIWSEIPGLVTATEEEKGWFGSVTIKEKTVEYVSYPQNGQVLQMERSTRQIRFASKHNNTSRQNEMFVRNVKVTMAKYLEFADGNTTTTLTIPDNEINIKGENATSNTVTFNWCNINDITSISCDNDNFEIVPLDEYSRVGAWGTTKLTIKCLHKVAGPHTGMVTIKSTSQGNLTITVSSTTSKKPSTITWSESISENLSLGEVIENAVSTVEGAGALTLESSNPDVLLVEGTTVTAVGVGENVTLTAKVAASTDGQFEANEDKKTITVDNKLRQTITWEQTDIAVIPLGSAPIKLTASTDAAPAEKYPLIYTSSDPTIASIEQTEEGYFLNVHDKTGRVDITVSQAGDEENYFSAYLTKNIVVYAPDEACPDFLLASGGFTIERRAWGDDTYSAEESLTWDAAKPAAKLNFTVKGTRDFTVYIDVFRKGSDTKEENWKSVSVTTSEQNISYDLDRDISGVNFRVEWAAAQNRTATFSNIEVYQLAYITPSVTEFTFNPLNLNTTASQEITIDYSALASMSGMYLEKTDKVFSVENIPFGGGCGSVGSQTFKVNFSSVGLTTADCATYENAILIINSQSETVLRIPITGKVEQLAQVIEWKPETNIKVTDQLTVPATTSASLPITYTSSDTEIAYVNEAHELVILKHGTVTIAATAEGTDKYQAAAAVEKHFTISALSYTIALDELATLEVGQALGTLTPSGIATDEAGNTVEGTFAWADETIVPAAGSTAEYEVIFTPTNTNHYEAKTQKVSVSVNKQAHTISWEQEQTAFTMIDVITLNATSSAGLPIIYTSLNEEVATVNADNILTLHQEGAVTIQATAAGNEAYADAALVEKAFTISLAPVTITVNTPEAVTIGAALSEISLTGTAEDANGAEVLGTFAFETPDTKPEVNGIYTVVFTPENSTVYATATAQVDITVNKLTQTITWVPTETTVQTIDQLTLDATTSAEGIAVTYTTLPEGVVTVDETGVVSIIKAGTVTITATAAENTTYHAAEPVSHTFTIEPTIYTISINELPVLEAGQALSALTLSGLATDVAGNPVEGQFAFEDATLIPAAGSTETYNVIFTPNNINYYEAQTQEVAVSVNKHAHTISWEQEQTAFTMIDVITLNATSSASLKVTYTSLNEDVATVNGDNTLTLHKTGDVTIQAIAEGNESVANAQTIEKTFTISLADVNITVNTPAPIDFNQALNTISLTGTAQDAKGAEVLGTFYFETPDYIPAVSGSAAYNVIFKPTDAHIYAEATSQVEVTVNKQTQNILWSSETNITTIDILTFPATTDAGTSIKYESNEPTIAFVNDNFELVIVQAGEVTITATAEATDAYGAASATHTFNISKATYQLEYAFTALKLEAGNALNTLEAELSAKGVDGNENEVTGTLTFVEPNTTPTEIGVQTFEATFTPDNSNYYETQTVTLSVEVFKQAGTGTALENTQQETVPAQKILLNGKVYIIHDGEIYTITGLKLQE